MLTRAASWRRMPPGPGLPAAIRAEGAVSLSLSLSLSPSPSLPLSLPLLLSLRALHSTGTVLASASTVQVYEADRDRQRAGTLDRYGGLEFGLLRCWRCGLTAAERRATRCCRRRCSETGPTSPWRLPGPWPPRPSSSGAALGIGQRTEKGKSTFSVGFEA